MRTTSALFAALVAASSVASHDTQPPRRMFYPRHVKRQFTNITVTPEEITPTETENTQATSTTSRQSLNDIVDGVLENLFPTGSSTLTSTGEGVQSTPFVSPTLSSNSTTEVTENNESLTDAKSSASSTVVSVAEPIAISTSSSIVLWPTTAITSDAPETTPAPDPTTSKTEDPLSSLFSEIEDILTSVLPRPNSTVAEVPPTSTPVETIPDITSTIPIPDITTTPSGTGQVTDPPIITSTSPPPEPPVTTSVIDPPINTNTTDNNPPIETSTSVTLPPPDVTTSTLPPPDITSSTLPPPVITSTGSSSTVTPPPIISTTATNNVTDPIVTTSVSTTGDGVTSIAPLRTVTNSQSWLPSTVLLDSTSSKTASGLAPTTATGIPTELPKAINPPSAAAQPEDTEIIQIGLLQGYNYKFVVDETKAAAQVFNLLPKALSYAAGADEGKVKARDDGAAVFRNKITARKLQPLDTVSSLGYLTTVVLVSYPRHLIEALRMDIKLPTSALYNNPDPLVYNFTKQINPAIDITLGSGIDLPSFGDGKGDAPGSTGKNDPFGNANKDEKDTGKQAATAGIVTGAVAVAAAYGAAMFVIARRYKKKKQAHRRASSLTGSGRSSPSDMQETYRGSPAMGGALLSRDFTSNSNSNYGGVSSGGRERDSHGSHGSGKSGMNTSSRTQYISAPVGAQNSLGWN
ncbi:hypothetical protein QBC39DRAFT_141282 [Podospora conica]|nr:hypothetical protein QBC39DRAFT_141282 [Schizothecium conicum]